MAPADTLALPVITVHGVPSEPGTSPEPSVYERSMATS